MFPCCWASNQFLSWSVKKLAMYELFFSEGQSYGVLQYFLVLFALRVSLILVQTTRSYYFESIVCSTIFWAGIMTSSQGKSQENKT